MSTLAKRCSQFGWFSSLELHNKVYIYSRYQKQGPAVNLSGALTLLVVEGHWVRSSLSLSLSFGTEKVKVLQVSMLSSVEVLSSLSQIPQSKWTS